MRRRFPALLASLFLASVLAPIGAGIASDGPSLIARKSATVSGGSAMKSSTPTRPAGRRWN